jgi:hypothetical protein
MYRSLASIVALGVAALCLLIAGQARAGVIEGFESGIPGTWVIAGNAAVSPAATNISPTEGKQFAWMNNLGSIPTTFTGIGGSTTGSVLTSSTYTLAGGSTLAMDLNFQTNDGTTTFADYAIVYLLQGGVPVATLYTAQTGSGDPQIVPSSGNAGGVSAGVTLSPSTAFMDGILTGPDPFGQSYGPGKFGGGNGGSTGWVNSSFVIPSTGAYQFEFVVSNEGDEGVSSGLAIDNITNSSSQVVPEPSTISLFGIGFVGLIGLVRRWRLV